MKGKEKCKILKEIRAEIAKNNDIEWIVSECKHQGDCLGTCPKCEAELVSLERALERRKSMGKAIQVTGLSIALAGCSIFSNVIDPGTETMGDVPYQAPEGELDGDVVELEGDVEQIPEDDGDIDVTEGEVESVDTE